MKRLLLTELLAGSVGPALAADTASGSFKNRDLGMEIRSALAFHGKSFLDQSDVEGGAPGKAYLDYHVALVKCDANALRTVLSDDVRKIQAGAIKEGKRAANMNYLAKEHPTPSVKIIKGWSNGKAAVILFDGASSSPAKPSSSMKAAVGGSMTS